MNPAWDADIAASAPKTNIENKIVGQAIVGLQSDVRQRLRFVLLSEDGSALAVEQAQQFMMAELKALEAVAWVGDESHIFNQAMTALLPYRFHLLTQSQRETLLNATDDQIKSEALRSLYGVGGGRLLGFDNDPFGIHQSALLSFIGRLSSSRGDSAKSTAFASLSVLLNERALDANKKINLGRYLDELLVLTQNNYPVKVYRSGVFFFANDAAITAKTDISRISSISTLGILFVLWLVFRQWRALLLPALSVLVGVWFAVIFTHTVLGNLSLITLIFGVGLIGVVVDYAIHYMYHRAYASTSQVKHKKELFSALLFSASTSVLAYAALYFSSIPVLQRVAMFSAAGIVMSLLFVLSFGSWFVEYKNQATDVRKNKSLSKVVFALRYLVSKLTPVISVVVFSVLAISTVIALCLSPFNDKAKLLYQPEPRLLEEEKQVAALNDEYEPGQFIVLSAKTAEELLQLSAAFNQALIVQDKSMADTVFSLNEKLPSTGQQQLNYHAMSRLYASPDLYQALVERIGAAEKNETLFTDYARSEGRELSIGQLYQALQPALPPLFYSQENGVASILLVKKGADLPLLKEIVNTFSSEVPGGQSIWFYNASAELSNSFRVQRESSLYLLGVAYILVAVLLLIRYRSVQSTSCLFVPLSASMMVFLLLFLFSVPINLFHVMAFFLVLGYGMDYAIFAHQMGGDGGLAMESIVLSAITSLFSFGLLSISSIPVVSSFGVVLLAGNIGNLFAVFVLQHNQEVSAYG